MTRHRFETYLDKVFGFSDWVSALPEGRRFPQHSWKKDAAAKNEPERKRVRERLRSELTGEFEFLKEELGLGKAETLFTVDTAALVTLGTAIAFGGPVGIAGAAVTGARSVLGKVTGWQSKKNAAMLKRAAAAYMYVFKNTVNAGKPLTASA